MEEKFLTKADLETYRKSIVQHLKGLELDYANFTKLLEMTDERIKNKKDDVDKIVDEVTNVNGTAIVNN